MVISLLVINNWITINFLINPIVKGNPPIESILIHKLILIVMLNSLSTNWLIKLTLRFFTDLTNKITIIEYKVK